MGEGGLLILLLALAAGLIALVFSILALIWRIVGGVLSAIGRLLGVRVHRLDDDPPPGAGSRVCGNPLCRRTEVRAARYCSRCGHTLA